MFSTSPLASRAKLVAQLALAALAAMLLIGQGAWAQIPSQARYGDENIAARLYADGAPKAGETWMLGLQFAPKSAEWHGYWSNPGDAGQGMRLVLDLPEGWEAGKPQYPVPERLLIGSLMNHIYKGGYTVLVPVSVPQGAEVSRIAHVTGYVEYLACTDAICVPQDAVLEARTGGDFVRWRTQIAPVLDAAASFELAGENLRLAIPLPGAVDLPDPHIFIANEQFVEPAAVQVFRRSGDMLVAEIPLAQYRADTPSAIGGIVSFGNGTGVEFGADAGAVPTGGEVIAGSAALPLIPPLWTLILGALAGGLLLNIMPCVFPILSLKALSLARAGESEAKARSEGLAYTAGVVLACVALGGLLLALRAAGEQVGWAFQLQEPGVVVALLVLAAAITANFAGLFELPSLSFTRSGEPAGAFATGLLAALVATPCTGPFMAAALGAALLLPVGQALVLFALLGLGLALPFLLLGFVPPLRRMLPRPGAWMERFRRIMAVPMGLTALALVWLAAQLGGQMFALIALSMVFGIMLGLLVVGRLQRAGKMAWPALGLIVAPFVMFGIVAMPASFVVQNGKSSQSLHAPIAFSETALANARRTGQPVFLWFTADWCVTCKVNEGIAIEREEVVAAFEAAGVVAMVGDWTVRDEAITRFLTAKGAAGVPLYLWYPAGADQPEQLPQVLTPDMLIQRAKVPQAQAQAQAQGSGNLRATASATGSD